MLLIQKNVKYGKKNIKNKTYEKYILPRRKEIS